MVKRVETDATDHGKISFKAFEYPLGKHAWILSVPCRMEGDVDAEFPAETLRIFRRLWSA